MKRLKKRLAVSMAIVTSLSFCLGMVATPLGDGRAAIVKAKTKAKTQTINLEKGDTYKIKIKKNSKIKLSRKKIVSISKKGKIKALKVGKCKIIVKNGKKTWKYNVMVRKKKIVTTPTPTQSALPTQAPIPSATPADYEILSGFIVSSIWRHDNNYSYVSLRDDPDVEGRFMPNDPEVTSVVIMVSNQKLKDISPGCGVSILIYHSSKSEVGGGVCLYYGVNDIRLDKYKVSAQPTPTQTPTHCYFPTPRPTPTPTCPPKADTWLSFDIDQEKVTKETEVISGTLYYNNNITTYIDIRVNGHLVVSEEYEPGTGRFSIPVDFSEYEDGSEISIGYSGVGVHEYHAVWSTSTTFLLGIANDIFLELEIDQETITKETTIISGKFKNNKNISTSLRIRTEDWGFNTFLLYDPGTETFSVPVDLSEFQTGDKLIIEYDINGWYIEGIVYPKNIEIELK